MMREHPDAYSATRERPAERQAASRSDHSAGADDPARAARRRRHRLRHCVLERRQPDPGARQFAAKGSWPCVRRSARARARSGGRCSPRAWCSAAPAPCWAWRWRGRSSPSSRGFAARFSVRALEVTVDASLLWVGAGLAMAAAVLLAYIPRLPSPHVAPTGTSAAGERQQLRITPGTNRRLRVFAMTQIAFSFVLLAGAGTLLAALVALQTANTGYNMRQVLALDLPTPSIVHQGRTGDGLLSGGDAADRELPGVEGVALGNFVPWRDAGRSPSGSPVRRRRLHARGRRRAPARAAADRHAGLLRRARRAAARRPRLHRRRSRRQRARGDREPERRPAAVPERRCA